MQTFNNELLESLGTYFSALSRLGYMSYFEVDKLIAVLFMGEILDGLFDVLVSEEDFKSITNAINCLHGCSCILPYPNMSRGESIKSPSSLLSPRITEQCVLRSTEFDDLRGTE